MCPSVTGKPRPANEAPRPTHNADPKLVAAVRKLSDRYLEVINSDDLSVLPGKYDVSRSVEDAPNVVRAIPLEVRQLPAAA